MSADKQGRNLPLSPARRMVIELMHHARKVPSVPVARRMNMASVEGARRLSPQRPSWTAIFIRAFGLVAHQFPQFRRSYIPWPYPRLYEHPKSICALAVEREWEGETVVLASKIQKPEFRPLGEIQNELRRLKEAPVWENSSFRQLLRLGRLPLPLRRFVMHTSLYWSGFKRAKRLGTFMVSSYGSLGAESLHPITSLTTMLTFGPISTSGEVVVKIIYDHRVLDGGDVARALAYMEEVLNGQIVGELSFRHRKVA